MIIDVKMMEKIEKVNETETKNKEKKEGGNKERRGEINNKLKKRRRGK